MADESLTDKLNDFAPVDGWKGWVGLFVVVVVIVALAMRFGIQKKVNKAVGAK